MAILLSEHVKVAALLMITVSTNTRSEEFWTQYSVKVRVRMATMTHMSSNRMYR